MARASRDGFGMKILAALFVVGLLAGCAGGPAAVSTDPCEPCGPCATAPAPASGPPCDVPDGVNPGEAWCRVWIPAEYATQVETVCVKPASQRKVMIPPVYGQRPKIVCLEEAQLRERLVPAVWDVTQREVEVCPPQECWKRICCPPSKELDPCEVQGECWAKVERPAVYKTEPCPVCIEPERRCVQYTPAQYKVVQERYMVEPARCETVCEPPAFEQRCKKVCVNPGRWEWRRNESCEVPQACAPVPCAPAPVPCAPAPLPGPEPLPAIQVEMQDNGPSGEKAGIFAVGDVVRYDLTVISDEGSSGSSGLSVIFTLPAELEFVSGGGDVAVSGSGQSATSDAFDLTVGRTVKMHVLCKVTAVSPTNLVELTASVQDPTGMELSVEKESTTLTP